MKKDITYVILCLMQLLCSGVFAAYATVAVVNKDKYLTILFLMLLLLFAQYSVRTLLKFNRKVREENDSIS